MDQYRQANAIAFADHVRGKFPFRIHTVRTDRDHEFQALFHWRTAQDMEQRIEAAQKQYQEALDVLVAACRQKAGKQARK